MFFFLVICRYMWLQNPIHVHLFLQTVCPLPSEVSNCSQRVFVAHVLPVGETMQSFARMTSKERGLQDSPIPTVFTVIICRLLWGNINLSLNTIASPVRTSKQVSSLPSRTSGELVLSVCEEATSNPGQAVGFS